MADIASLRKDFKGDIVEPGNPEYLTAIARWSKTAERKARYVLFPKDEADVSAAVKFVTSNSIPLAVKGGGHNPSGVSSVEDGVCVDLSRYFHTTSVDLVQSAAYVGGGALWKSVDHAAIVHGLATPGGTVNHTGVGGLTLGGGYGWLSGEHGLVVDNLIQATVVTADGSIVTASPTSHPDLYWAIRGGGGNFGIVTQFVLKLHPQRKTVFAGPLIFPPAMLGQVTETLDQYWPEMGEKEGVMLVLTRGPDSQPAVLVMLFFNGSEEEGRAKFERLYALGPVVDLAHEIPFENLNELLNDKVVPGRNFYLNGTSLRSSASPHIHKLFDHVMSMSAAHPLQSTLPPYGITILYEFFPLKKICAIPSDSTAFRSRGPQPNVTCVIVWDKDTEGGGDLANARKISQETVTIIESTQERPLMESENELYGNYVTDAPLMVEKVRVLWGENYPRLQKIKKDYDPNCLFNRWFPILPAV